MRKGASEGFYPPPQPTLASYATADKPLEYQQDHQDEVRQVSIQVL